jgi:hypothetical protein
MERSGKTDKTGDQVRFFTGRTAAGLALVVPVAILVLIVIRYCYL